MGSLKKGELYLVTNQCQDGWFKGQNVKTGEVGVFPGNHVKPHDPKKTGKKDSLTKEENLIDLGEGGQSKVTETDSERLEKLKKNIDKVRHQQGQTSSQTKTKAER